MVLVKILVVLALLMAGLAAVQQQRVIERAGVTGSCEEVRSPVAEPSGPQWWSCKEGIVTGYPSLVKDNCTLEVVTKTRQVWRCAVPIERPAALI
jgi:hypothetical protein